MRSLLTAPALHLAVWLAIIAVLSTSLPAHDRVAPLLWRLLRSLGSQIDPAGAGEVAWLLRKAAHPVVYGILAVLMLRCVRPARRSFAVYLAVFALAVAVGIADEVHQSFIPERSGQVSDVLLDAAGTAVALAVYYRVRGRQHFFRRRRRSPARIEW